MIQKLKNKLGKDANLRELLSGSAITFVIKVVGMGISYVVILLISRKYGAAGVGVYGLTSRLLNSLAILGALGMNISVLRYVGQFTQNENASDWLKRLYTHIIKLAFPFAIIVGGGLYLLSERIAVSLFDNPVYIPALRISAFALPFFTLNLINVEFIRGLKLLKVSEYLRSINRQAIIILLLLLSVFSYGVLDSVYALVTGLLATFVFSMGFILQFFRKHKPRSLPKNSFTAKELAKTSLPMMTTAVASFILANASAIFLEAFTTTDQVGIFSVCARLSQLVGLILIVVNTISAPKFSELFWAEKKEELQVYIQHSARLIFWVSLGISIILIIFSRWILGFFGKEFVVGVLTLSILIIGQMINAFAGSVGIFMNMSGHQKVFRNVMLVAIAIIVISYLILVPKYGILGAAIVTVIGQVCINIYPAIYTYRKLGISTVYNPFFKK